MKKNVIMYHMKRIKKNRLMICSAVASMLTAISLMALKTVGFLGTGSVAVLSSLLDSVQDFLTASINMVAVHQAIQPADKAHRFGHGKAQGIGSLIQSVIIGLSAIWLLKESLGHLINHTAVHNAQLGVWVVLISGGITVGLVGFQNYVVKHTGALSIKADRAHYMGDVLMNLGVLVSLWLSTAFGIVWVDGVFGILVALYLLYSIWHIMVEACAMLMDKELPQKIRQDIRALAMNVALVKNVSSLKSREGGNNRFVQFNVQFDGDISLKTAHEQLDEIEKNILQKYPDMQVIIHAEPFDETKLKQ